MAGEPGSFEAGRRVTVTAPEAVPGRVAERLSTDRVVEVAIEQMRAHGYDAVTMRSIARELGTGPASLYAHVANRAELDQLVVGRVCSQWRIPEPDPRRWDEQLRTSLVDLLDLYRANPGVARCTMGMIPLDPGALVVTERFLALLRAGEVDDQHAGWFLDVASLYVASVAMEEDIWRERAAGTRSGQVGEEDVAAGVRALFDRLPADHFPLLSSLSVSLTSGSGDDRFRFGLDLLVGGLKALGSATP